MPSATGRIAWLCHPMLTHELLDVVWNQYPASQHGMLGWLNHLASHQQAVVRQRAALAAAVFAEFDFEQVVANLLGDWAGSYKARVATRPQGSDSHKQPATRDSPGPSRGRSTKLISREWLLLQETAARAYAVGLTALVPVRSVLNDLHAIGQNEKALASPAVADALEALSAPSTIGAIATALVEWQKSGHECLVAHSTRGSSHSRDRTAMTHRRRGRCCSRGQRRIQKDRTYWHARSLSYRGPHTCGAICETVHRWIVTAEYDGPMAEVLLAVLTQVSTDMEARRRLRYHFARQWRSGAHVGPVARRVTALVEGEE